MAYLQQHEDFVVILTAMNPSAKHFKPLAVLSVLLIKGVEYRVFIDAHGLSFIEIRNLISYVIAVYLDFKI